MFEKIFFACFLTIQWGFVPFLITPTSYVQSLIASVINLVHSLIQGQSCGSRSEISLVQDITRLIAFHSTTLNMYQRRMFSFLVIVWEVIRLICLVIIIVIVRYPRHRCLKNNTFFVGERISQLKSLIKSLHYTIAV